MGAKGKIKNGESYFCCWPEVPSHLFTALSAVVGRIAVNVNIWYSLTASISCAENGNKQIGLKDVGLGACVLARVMGQTCYMLPDTRKLGLVQYFTRSKFELRGSIVI